MHLVDTADKFGEAMATSKEYTRLLEAEKQYKEDKSASELVKEFRKKQKILSSTTGHSDIIDTKEIRKELTELFQEIEKNQVIKELNDALSEFLLLKQNVYEKIESYINIDDEIFSLNKGHGCNKGCGGCKK